MADSRKSRSTEALRSAVLNCLSRRVDPEHELVVGLSGGVDSVVLLHAVRYAGYPVSALHVHHGLSRLADDWLGFCADLCRELRVEFSVERVVVERDSADGLEAAARRARHAAYDRTDADWVLLAHHQRDRAETMLFNLLRGAGVRGAGALRERSGRILRPLVRVDRTDIIEYATANGLHWIEDDSNTDLRFSRNFLRHRVFPAIEERFPAATGRLAAAAGHLSEAADLLDELALMDLAAGKPEFPVCVDLLAGLTEARGRNVLRFLLWRAGVGIPSEERLTEALRQCLTASPDRHPAIVFGDRVLRRRGKQVVLEVA